MVNRCVCVYVCVTAYIIILLLKQLCLQAVSECSCSVTQINKSYNYSCKKTVLLPISVFQQAFCDMQPQINS